MKEIDLNNWNRASHYKLFGSYMQPCFRIDVRLNVTKIVENKEKLGGLFPPFCYLVMHSLNKFEGAKIREIEKEKLVVFDKISPSFTVNLDDGNFAFCICEYIESYAEFLSQYRQEVDAVKNNLKNGDYCCFRTNNRADLAYISCLPWIDVTSLENPLPLGDKFSLAIPRINWGKFVKTGNGYEVTLSATFNHAYIDGREASEIINDLASNLARVEEILLDTK